MQKQHRMSLFVFVLTAALVLAARALPSRVYQVQASPVPAAGLHCCLTDLRDHDALTQHTLKYYLDRNCEPQAVETSAQVVIRGMCRVKPALLLRRAGIHNSTKRPLSAGAVSAKINLHKPGTILVYRLSQVRSSALTRISVTPLTRGPTSEIC